MRRSPALCPVGTGHLDLKAPPSIHAHGAALWPAVLLAQALIDQILPKLCPVNLLRARLFGLLYGLRTAAADDTRKQKDLPAASNNPAKAFLEFHTLASSLSK